MPQEGSGAGVADGTSGAVQDVVQDVRTEEGTLRLQVLTEELSVADEELAAQQREIDDLLAQSQDSRRALGAITRTVPVPVLLTDAAGSIVEANPASATLFGVPGARLARKPVQALVTSGDRHAVRDLVSAAVADGTADGTLSIVPRGGSPRAVRIAVTTAGRLVDGRPSLTWVLVPETSTLPETSTPAAPSSAAPSSAAPSSAAPSAATAGAESTDAVLQAVAALATLPVGDVGTHELLARIAGLATQAVAGGSWSSVALGDPADPSEVATDSTQAQLVDGAQFSSGQGPSVTAYRENALVVTEDMTSDPRWPVLNDLAGTTPARSALALPIRAADGVSGVLTVFGAQAGALGGEQQVARALIFADAAAAVLRDLQRIDELRSTAENLRSAMQSRATIEQAKGLVAGWLGCPVEEAFAVISRVSQDRNVKVRDIAGLVVTDPARRDLLPLLQETRRRLAGARQASAN